MEWAWIWKSAFLVLVGMALLRVAGRKSISQMSVATTVIMISIGTTIVQPIANSDLWKAIGSASIFIGSLIIIEFLQVKFNWFEKIMGGESKVVIENGQLKRENLKILRLTVDQLEMRLRQNGISNIEDVQTATMESNGQVGFELKRHAKPITIGEMERLLGLRYGVDLEQNKLFQEVKQKHHASPPDPSLQ